MSELVREVTELAACTDEAETAGLGHGDCEGGERNQAHGCAGDEGGVGPWIVGGQGGCHGVGDWTGDDDAWYRYKVLGIF